MTNIIHNAIVRQDGNIKTRVSRTLGVELGVDSIAIHQSGDSGWNVVLNNERIASFATQTDAESFASGMKQGMMGK